MQLSESKIRKIIKEEINKLFLFETIRKDIRSIINEEYGISKLVSDEYKNLSNYIRNYYKSIPSKIDNNGISFIDGSSPFNEWLFIKLKINFRIYNFQTMEEYLTYSKKYAKYSANAYTSNDIDNNSYIITIVCPSINGKLPKRYFDDSIQHEIEHIYQIIQSEQPNLFGKKDKLYQRVVAISNNLMNDKDFSNDELQQLNYALYISFNAEQDAFINGLDATIEPNVDINTQVEDSSLYNLLLNLKNIIFKIENANEYDEIILKLMSYYKLSKKTALNFLTKGYDRLIKKIGRIVYKYKFDINND